MDNMLRRLAHGPAIPLATALIIFVIVLVQALALWKSRVDTWADATRSAENILGTLATTIERNFELIELSMSGVEDALALPGLTLMSPEVRHLLLFDRAAGARYLGSMLVLDENGSIFFDSGSVVPRQGNFADRDYFIAQREPGSGTFLGAPYASRLRKDDPSIGMSRRRSRPDGSFNGIVLAAVRIAFFKSLFDKVQLGPGSIVALVRTDGTMIYRYPSTDGKGNVGARIGLSPVMQSLISEPHKPQFGRSKLDGVERYYVHKRISHFPLVLTVGFSVAGVYADWNTQAIALSLLTFGVCAVLALMVLALKRALVRSYEMEEQLEHMAVTDVLTQMPNRRALDMALDTEMRRAARDKTELSVLVVDIDYFKQVNDTHGHTFGDAMLRQAGRQVLRSIRRPGDFAARYGGEEFVVILPSTGQAGALFIAERIRAAIEANSLITPDGTKVSVTASMGVASGRVALSHSMDTILHRADLALYEAKKTGRNRVVCAGTNDSSVPSARQ